MTSHGQVAAKVHAHKEAHPELYCVVPGCLWRVVTSVGPKSHNPCRKHPKVIDLMEALKRSLKAEGEAK